MQAARPSDAPLRNAVNLLERRFSGHEDMAIEDFISFFRRPAPGPTPNSDLASRIVRTLRAAISDDDAFHRELHKAAAMRGVTKAVLTSIYAELFGSSAGIPSKSTKPQLVRLIEDERLIRVRNEKMGAMLGRRVVPAE